MSLKYRWLCVLILVSAPYLALGAAGMVWLWERNLWLPWFAIATALAIVGRPLLQWLQRRGRPPVEARVEPAPTWSPAGRKAWESIEALAARTTEQDLPLDSPEALWNLLRQILETVARRYHPRSKQAFLEVPVPHLLRLVELVAQDLRLAFSDNIPGSHILTINDILRLQRLARLTPTLYRFYRVISLVVSPATALARELNSYMQGRMMDASAQETKKWAVQFAIKRAGYYAIELYSGHLVLDRLAFNPSYTSRSSQQALAQEQRREAAFDAEPLRILVLGQVKAGKSSLVNALFGETKAAVDVVPRTRHVEPYLLEREGLARAIILDTAGYDDASRAAETLEEARAEILRSDLVILTTSAQTAARDADRRLLDEVRGIFQRDPNREFPALVVVLTHIDRLRPFREWSPPYDLSHPTNPKAEQIRAALEATASDLQVEHNQIVPVCLLPGEEYNVQEGLIPAILNSLGTAQRVRYLRCLREFHDDEYWNLLWAQAGNAGRVLLKAGAEALGHAVRKLDDASRDFTETKR